MTNHDDLRSLVENDLAILAYQIMSSGPRRMPSAAFASRQNHVHDDHTWWEGADKAGRLSFAGPVEIAGQDGYHYKAPHPDGVLKDEWYIAFYGIRLVDIDSVDPQPVQVLNPEAVKLKSVAKERNYSPGFKEYDIQVTERADKEKEASFGVTASNEFELTMERKAKAGIGIAEGEQSMTARFMAKMEARTDHAWRESDSLQNYVGEKFEIFPYHDYELTVKEGTPRLRQAIPTRGLLECGISIDIRNANQQTWDTYGDLVQTWRGLKTGHEFYSAWFGRGRGVPEADLAGWLRPHLTLNITVEGDRVRYSEKDTLHRPIPGMEAEAKRYVDARLAAI